MKRKSIDESINRLDELRKYKKIIDEQIRIEELHIHNYNLRNYNQYLVLINNLPTCIGQVILEYANIKYCPIHDSYLPDDLQTCMLCYYGYKSFNNLSSWLSYETSKPMISNRYLYFHSDDFLIEKHIADKVRCDNVYFYECPNLSDNGNLCILMTDAHIDGHNRTLMIFYTNFDDILEAKISYEHFVDYCHWIKF